MEKKSTFKSIDNVNKSIASELSSKVLKDGKPNQNLDMLGEDNVFITDSNIRITNTWNLEQQNNSPTNLGKISMLTKQRSFKKADSEVEEGEARRQSINPSVYTFANPAGSKVDTNSTKFDVETGTEGTPQNFANVQNIAEQLNNSLKEQRSNSVPDHRINLR